MNIPISSPSQTVQAIWQLGDKIQQIPFDRHFAVLTGLETAFYASLRGLPPDYWIRLIKRIQQISVENIHLIQTMFNLSNLASSCFSSYKLVQMIERRYAILFLVLRLAASLALYSYHKASQVSPILAENNDITTSKKLNLNQKLAQHLHLSQMITNLALAYLLQDRVCFLFNVAGAVYNFVRNFQIKWLSVERKFKYNLASQPRIKELSVAYNMLLLTGAEENCAICWGDQAYISFCSNHIFHQHCLDDMIKTKSDFFLKDGHICRTETKNYSDGTGTTHSYSVKIPENNLPSCPLCRAFPPQNSCEISVQDADYGTFNANVHLTRAPVNNQSLHEKICMTYSLIAAGLAYFERYPELAPTIFKIQKFLIVGDVITLGMTTYHLMGKDELNNRQGALTIGSVALACLAVLGLTVYLRPTLVLKDLLKVSPDALQKITLKWSSPFIYKVMQFLSVTRILATFALSFFSTQRKTNLVSTVAQILTLFRLSQLRFINLRYAWDHTFGLKNLTVNSYFIIPSSCSQEAMHLQSAVNTIYNYIHHLFDKAKWEPWWMVYKTNYVETGRKFFYKVFLNNPILKSCECSLMLSLENLTIKGLHNQHGSIKIKSFESAHPSLWESFCEFWKDMFF